MPIYPKESIYSSKKNRIACLWIEIESNREISLNPQPSRGVSESLTALCLCVCRGAPARSCRRSWGGGRRSWRRRRAIPAWSPSTRGAATDPSLTSVTSDLLQDAVERAQFAAIMRRRQELLDPSDNGTGSDADERAWRDARGSWLLGDMRTLLRRSPQVPVRTSEQYVV